MPSPVELTQLKIQYQRNVGTESASNRIELGATTPAPGSTSRASAFCSLTSQRLGEQRPRVAPMSRVEQRRGLLSERPLAGGSSRSHEGPSEEDPGAAHTRPRATRNAASVAAA